MKRASHYSSLLLTLSLFAIAIGLLSLPDELTRPIRLAGRDAGWPGQIMTHLVWSWCHQRWTDLSYWSVRQSDLRDLQNQLASERSTIAAYRKELARLRKEAANFQRHHSTGVTGTTTEALFLPDMLQARVIGSEVVALNRGKQILGAGSAQGVGELLLVVDAGRSILDLGSDHGLSIHQPVFAGEMVVGCTETCGRFSSTLRPVTDRKFRGPAQLLAKSESGFQPGPVGVVEGTGERICQLSGIWRREPVEIGDEVYTPLNDHQVPYPMFYGRVVRAELKDGAAHWEIDIEPAALNLRLTEVTILRPTVNPVRLASNHGP